jgi:hypothetical protein
VTEIPVAAWQQAVFVVLFVVGFSALLIILVRLFLQLVVATKSIISETNNSFQQFVDQRDKAWQNYLKDLRASDKDEQKLREEAFALRNDLVVENLKNLSMQIHVQQDFDNLHHQVMTVAIEDMRRLRGGRSSKKVEGE